MALPAKVTGIVPDQSTNANFRAWGSNVEALIANSGMLKVATAGEVDWTTATAPAGGGASGGFQIWKFNDTLQATAPVYFRIDYQGAGAGGRPSFKISLGANVSGNAIVALGGAAPTPNANFDVNNSSTTTNLVSWACGNASSLMLALCMVVSNLTFSAAGGPPYDTSGSVPIIVSIERTKDAFGADTTEGVWIFGNSGGVSVRGWQQIYWSGTTGPGTSAYEGSPGMIAPSTTGPDNKMPNQIGFFPNYFTKPGGVFSGPSLNIMHTLQNGPAGAAGFGFGSSLLGQVVVVPLYGANHNYLTFSPLQTGNNMVRGSGASNTSVMVRYE